MQLRITLSDRKLLHIWKPFDSLPLLEENQKNHTALTCLGAWWRDARNTSNNLLLVVVGWAALPTLQTSFILYMLVILKLSKKAVKIKDIDLELSNGTLLSIYCFEIGNLLKCLK